MAGGLNDALYQLIKFKVEKEKDESDRSKQQKAEQEFRTSRYNAQKRREDFACAYNYTITCIICHKSSWHRQLC